MGNVFGKDEDHVRRDQGTTADLKVYADAREQLGQLRAPVLLHADNPHERLYVAAMDGTGNSMRTDSSENWSAMASPVTMATLPSKCRNMAIPWKEEATDYPAHPAPRIDLDQSPRAAARIHPPCGGTQVVMAMLGCG